MPKRPGRALTALLTALGLVLGSSVYKLFLTPNHISAGGFTGIGIVLNYLMNVPVGAFGLLMNIPLLLISCREIGTSFALRTAVSVIAYHLLIDLLPFQAMASEPLLCAIFGGLLLGIGRGLIVRCGTTTGGTDLLAYLIKRRMPHLSVGTILQVLDMSTILLAGAVIGAEYAMYALVCIYFSGKAVDMAVSGLSHEKVCYVITDSPDILKTAIYRSMRRGITMLRCEGGYTGKAHSMLMCVLSAQQLARLKQIVYEEDEHAFVIVSDAAEVLGEGFTRYADAGV